MPVFSRPRISIGKMLLAGIFLLWHSLFYWKWPSESTWQPKEARKALFLDSPRSLDFSTMVGYHKSAYLKSEFIRWITFKYKLSPSCSSDSFAPCRKSQYSLPHIRQGKPERAEKSGAWQIAIGLQAVDGLKTSDYLLNTAKRNY